MMLLLCSIVWGKALPSIGENGLCHCIDDEICANINKIKSAEIMLRSNVLLIDVHDPIRGVWYRDLYAQRVVVEFKANDTDEYITKDTTFLMNEGDDGNFYVITFVSTRVFRRDIDNGEVIVKKAYDYDGKLVK